MRLLVLLFLAPWSLLFAASPLTYPVKIGSETVKIKVWQGSVDKVYVHLHQNETTALKAAKTTRLKDRAALLTLQHHGKRNIVFYLKRKKYEFDPNRIFTDKGIKASLVKYSHYSAEAYRAVKQLSNQIIRHLPAGRIVAVHNNQSYSFKDYLPQHALSSDAEARAFLQKSHYRNFYLVTCRDDFLRLKKGGENVVLQSSKVRDDGSLSVRYKNRPYVNVEAAYDQLAAQMAMLKRT